MQFLTRENFYQMEKIVIAMIFVSFTFTSASASMVAGWTVTRSTASGFSATVEQVTWCKGCQSRWTIGSNVTASQRVVVSLKQGDVKGYGFVGIVSVFDTVTEMWWPWAYTVPGTPVTVSVRKINQGVLIGIQCISARTNLFVGAQKRINFGTLWPQSPFIFLQAIDRTNFNNPKNAPIFHKWTSTNFPVPAQKTRRGWNITGWARAWIVY